MERNRTIKDIQDVKLEFQKLKERESLLHNRFLALGMDFKFYLSNSMKDDKIFEIRNDIFYRLYGSNFHIEILLNHFYRIQKQLENLFEKAKEEKSEQPFMQRRDVLSLNHFSTQQSSTLFDSVIYHLSTIFDYVGNIVNFIWGDKSSNKKPLKWTALARTARDKSQNLYSMKIGEKIRELDNSFVEPLYRHRSMLIHKQGDICNIVITLSNTEPSMVLRFMSTKKFCKNFGELRTLYKSDDMTMRFVIFWLMNKAYDAIKDILFALKEDLEKRGKHPHQRKGAGSAMIIGMIGENRQFISPSKGFWNEENPL